MLFVESKKDLKTCLEKRGAPVCDSFQLAERAGETQLAVLMKIHGILDPTVFRVREPVPLVAWWLVRRTV